MLLESLLNFADGAWISRFTLDLVGHSWPDLLQNPYASRVFDASLKALPRSNVGTKPVERPFDAPRPASSLFVLPLDYTYNSLVLTLGIGCIVCCSVAF